MFTSAVFASARSESSSFPHSYPQLTNVAPVKNLLLAGLAMMLIFEGILPFMAPRAWRETFRRVVELSDGQLRFIGLASIALGMLLLFLVT